MAGKPKWRNWQTRCVQGAVSISSCGFKSHLRHQTPRLRGVSISWVERRPRFADRPRRGAKAKPARPQAQCLHQQRRKGRRSTRRKLTLEGSVALAPR
jgi:hypothetical protein